jgi:hypothetical protein
MASTTQFSSSWGHFFDDFDRRRSRGSNKFVVVHLIIHTVYI